MADHATAERARIKFGGSVKPENARELTSKPDIDGPLVDGASLDARSFAPIVEARESAVSCRGVWLKRLNNGSVFAAPSTCLKLPHLLLGDCSRFSLVPFNVSGELLKIRRQSLNLLFLFNDLGLEARLLLQNC